jgi:nucleoid-associated protein YgaU
VSRPLAKQNTPYKTSAFMKTSILRYTTLLLISLGINAYAEEQPSVRADSPSSHTVVKGDTLWSISAKFLEDPWRWEEIWKGNSQIANPNLIYPNDVIHLIFVDGKPQLTVNSDSGNDSSSKKAPKPTSNNGELVTVKLSPKIRTAPIKTAISAIPLERINAFLSSNRIVEAEELENAPHIIAGQKQRILLGTGDPLYARGNFSSTSLNYGIYTKGKEYIDPETEEVIGVQAIALGKDKMKKQTGYVGTFIVTRSLREIRTDGGNRLLPNQQREITSTFLPTPPENEVTGTIVNTEGGLSQVGRLDVVTLNIGREDGLKQGTILGIYKVGGVIEDKFAEEKTPKEIELPNERAGLLMIFETFKKMSFAIVLEAETGVIVNDKVGNP